MANKRIKDLTAKTAIASGDYMAVDSSSGTRKVDAYAKVAQPIANIANPNATPDKYSSTKAYSVGDLAIQDNVLYRCKTACTAASWSTNSACFEATTLASAVTSLNQALTWQKLVKKKGDASTETSIPSSAKELAISWYDSSTSTGSSAVIALDAFYDTGQVYCCVSGSSGGYCKGAIFRILNGKIKLFSADAWTSGSSQVSIISYVTYSVWWR